MAGAPPRGAAQEGWRGMTRVNDLYKGYTAEEKSAMKQANESLSFDWQRNARKIAKEIIGYFIDHHVLMDEYIVTAMIAKAILAERQAE